MKPDTIPAIVAALCAEEISPPDAIAALNRIVANARDVRPYRCTFAAAALQGLLAAGWEEFEPTIPVDAREYADAMIAELEANPLGEP